MKKAKTHAGVERATTLTNNNQAKQLALLNIFGTSTKYENVQKACPFCVSKQKEDDVKVDFNIKKYMHEKCKTKNKRKGYDNKHHIKVKRK